MRINNNQITIESQILIFDFQLFYKFKLKSLWRNDLIDDQTKFFFYSTINKFQQLFQFFDIFIF